MNSHTISIQIQQALGLGDPAQQRTAAHALHEATLAGSVPLPCLTGIVESEADGAVKFYAINMLVSQLRVLWAQLLHEPAARDQAVSALLALLRSLDSAGAPAKLRLKACQGLCLLWLADPTRGVDAVLGAAQEAFAGSTASLPALQLALALVLETLERRHPMKTQAQHALAASAPAVLGWCVHALKLQGEAGRCAVQLLQQLCQAGVLAQPAAASCIAELVTRLVAQLSSAGLADGHSLGRALTEVLTASLRAKAAGPTLGACASAVSTLLARLAALRPHEVDVWHVQLVQACCAAAASAHAADSLPAHDAAHAQSVVPQLLAHCLMHSELEVVSAAGSACLALGEQPCVVALLPKLMWPQVASLVSRASRCDKAWESDAFGQWREHVAAPLLQRIFLLCDVRAFLQAVVPANMQADIVTVEYSAFLGRALVVGVRHALRGHTSAVLDERAAKHIVQQLMQAIGALPADAPALPVFTTARCASAYASYIAQDAAALPAILTVVLRALSAPQAANAAADALSSIVHKAARRLTSQHDLIRMASVLLQACTPRQSAHHASPLPAPLSASSAAFDVHESGVCSAPLQARCQALAALMRPAGLAKPEDCVATVQFILRQLLQRATAADLGTTAGQDLAADSITMLATMLRYSAHCPPVQGQPLAIAAMFELRTCLQSWHAAALTHASAALSDALAALLVAPIEALQWQAADLAADLVSLLEPLASAQQPGGTAAIIAACKVIEHWGCYAYDASKAGMRELRPALEPHLRALVSKAATAFLQQLQDAPMTHGWAACAALFKLAQQCCVSDPGLLMSCGAGAAQPLCVALWHAAVMAVQHCPEIDGQREAWAWLADVCLPAAAGRDAAVPRAQLAQAVTPALVARAPALAASIVQVLTLQADEMQTESAARVCACCLGWAHSGGAHAMQAALAQALRSWKPDASTCTMWTAQLAGPAVEQLARDAAGLHTTTHRVFARLEQSTSLLLRTMQVVRGEQQPDFAA